MTKEVQEQMNLRLSLSGEKLEMARIMLNAGRFNESVVFSYLSLFYSIRLLLIEQEEDSDDPEKILLLADRYFEPSGWSGVDILTIFRETKAAKEKIETEPSHRIGREMAEAFVRKAGSVRESILKKSGLAP